MRFAPGSTSTPAPRNAHVPRTVNGTGHTGVNGTGHTSDRWRSRRGRRAWPRRAPAFHIWSTRGPTSRRNATRRGMLRMAAAEVSHSAIVRPSVPSRVKMAVWKVVAIASLTTLSLPSLLYWVANGRESMTILTQALQLKFCARSLRPERRSFEPRMRLSKIVTSRHLVATNGHAAARRAGQKNQPEKPVNPPGGGWENARHHRDHTTHKLTQEGNSGSSSSNGYESSAASAAPSPLTPARMPTWGLSPPSNRSNRTS